MKTETALNRYQRMARRARPSIQKADSGTISAIVIGPDLKAEVMAVSQATGHSMSRVVRTFVEAHAGRLPVEYQRHRQMMEGE